MTADAISAVLAGHTRRGDELPIAFSDHSVERYGERTGRDLDADTGRRELSLMLASAVVTTTPPAWYDGTGDRRAGRRTIAFLIVGDLIQPLVEQDGELRATTTIHPGMRVAATDRKRTTQRDADDAKRDRAQREANYREQRQREVDRRQADAKGRRDRKRRQRRRPG